jgi:hypothetical protein
MVLVSQVPDGSYSGQTVYQPTDLQPLIFSAAVSEPATLSYLIYCTVNGDPNQVAPGSIVFEHLP